MRVLDLFAGIGGFSLAAHWMGWETSAFVEKEPFCQAVLKKNFPGVEIYGDITTFSGKPFRGTVDIITGGFPCQPFSVAGGRAGTADDRYLFPEALRIIREVQPAWVVLENVTGILSMAQQIRDIKVASLCNTHSEEIDYYEAIYTREETMLLNCICEEIEREGYSVQPVVVPAVALGADHKRDRVWIVAHADSQRERAGSREIQNSDGKISERNNNAEFSNAASCVAADTGNTRLQGIEQPGTLSQGTRTSRPTSERNSDVAHARRDRFGRWNQYEPGTREILPTRPSAAFWKFSWYGTAIRTCVRGIPDGLPAELDIIGSRDNRVARLKAIGNAIVPHAAYAIFQAIDQADKEL